MERVEGEEQREYKRYEDVRSVSFFNMKQVFINLVFF